MIIERLAILIVFVLVSMAVFLVLKQGHVRHLGQVMAVATAPTLLYFGSKSCAACPAQWRYVEQLRELCRDHLVIETIDADQEPAKAAQYRIFTLPTTVIIDPSGVIREINYGLTHTQKLKRQLEEMRE